MEPGGRVADRWELVGEAGRGGMGAVFRARDLRTGEPAAIKVLSGDRAELAARFEREARLLAELRHDAIVRYLAHGETPGGERWIAMEWLEGTTLMHHLRGNRVSVDEGLAMARGAAAALAYAHGRGVVHRDVKPSNLFLVDGQIDRIKLVDFGIARMGDGDLTRTGTRVGTPAYMAPEQVRGAKDVDGRCDVFALGVVLYQCLTRRRPFWSSDPRITLTKILTWDPPPVSFALPGVPRALDDLVARTLAKEPGDRYDALGLLEALESLGRVDGVNAGTLTLTEEEQRLQAVVVAFAPTGRVEPMREIATRHGGALETVSAQRVVARLSSSGAATDLAARAATCALAMRAAVPEAVVAITLGRGASGVSRPGVDEVLRRGSVLGPGATTVVRQDDDGPPIRVDRLVAQLLGERFDVGRDGSGWTLRGETTWTPRVLLGRPTACVAREAELAALRGAFEAVADEPMAKAVLITAPAGTGKSRLRFEFLHGLRASGEDACVLVGRGDPLRAGTPYGLVATAIREAVGIRDGEPVEASRRKLAARAGEDVAFLGELCGVTFPDDEDVQLRAARADAVLMADRIGRAFEAFLDEAARVRPLILVLEDLHWADVPTVRLVDAALRNLADRPLLVLATARPELEEQLPRLWSEREVQHIRLGPLPKRAARRLVRDVLGDVEDSVVEALIERAAGNAFYLEELIRVAADGDPREVPDTVLAMVQARLEAMEPAARRVLRAASVFGRAFWADGVARLVGPEARESTGLWLRALTEREVFQCRGTSRLAGQEEYAFRHDLVREAAYAMLTDADRALGHRLAGEWLDQAGEPDPGVLAEHHDRGGDAVRAVEGYTRAAQHALDNHDVDAAIARAERGLECGAAGQARGALLALLAEAQVWRGRFRAAMEAGEAALALLPPGTRASYAVVGELAVAAGVQGDADTLIALTALIVALPEVSESRHARLRAATRLAEQLLILGRVEATRPLFAMFDAAQVAEAPGLAGRIHSARALHACFVGDVEGNLRHVDEAMACFERAGDRRGATAKRERAGYTRMDLGAYTEAEAMLRDALTAAEELQLDNVASTARHNLGLALGRLGRFAEAIAMETEAAERFRASGNRRMEGASREYLAMIRLESGDPERAETEAREALRLSREPTLLPLNEAESLAILARVRVAQGRVEEAVDAAGAGLRRLESLGGIDDGEAIIRLAWAEALQAAGRGPEAAEALWVAAERLQARASRMSEPWRTTFLEQVPENRRTMELASLKVL